MPSTMRWRSRAPAGSARPGRPAAGRRPRAAIGWTIVLSGALTLAGGCAAIHNQFREDGPAAAAELNSPSAADILERCQPAPARFRDWELMPIGSEPGAVTHGPLYFEDPFEDKGRGDPQYRMGWEDFVAAPYCYARYYLNLIALPVSAVVTPPWTAMESDGRLSRQLLGYDHDAIPQSRRLPPSAPAEPLAAPD